MKLRLICTFLAVFLLTGCGNIADLSPTFDNDASGESVSSTSDGTLEYLREQAKQEGCLCAIAEVGYMMGDKDFKNIIADSEVVAQYPFLASVETISVYNGQIYAIVPVDPVGTVRIDEIQFGGSDGFQTVIKPGGFHYDGEATPFLLCCSESDFIGTVWVTVTDSSGQSVCIEPYHNLRDGYLSLPSEVYDFTPYDDEDFLVFVLGSIDEPDARDSWYDGDFDFSNEQAERLILGLRAMGWSTHKIIHFLNYVAYGDETHLNYVGSIEEASP